MSKPNFSLNPKQFVLDYVSQDNRMTCHPISHAVKNEYGTIQASFFTRQDVDRYLEREAHNGITEDHVYLYFNRAPEIRSMFELMFELAGFSFLEFTLATTNDLRDSIIEKLTKELQNES